ncbi:DUF4062 domain-containing protein [Alteribacillus sp. JSM 102045]|uniref:DUF4062 domain-containing protein n=1 Tax=Alteribacillus sp. JSM 102045 TaxID=1562101 RepID=UPI0035C04CAB
MINKTRIFISSAYEEDLKTPRKMVKKHLEESGHDVPIFEDGDFGTWEKDTLKQCQDVVRASDVFVLLIHRKSGASTKLLPGNVTPAYLEYKAAVMEKKHILVFVSPEVKENFFRIQKKLEDLHNTYLDNHHRKPDSPFEPFENWIKDEIENGGLAKQFLETADPFIWAFLFEVFQNGHWLYDFDISKSGEQAKNISAMLSTSLRSVVKFIPERDNLQKLKKQASQLLHFADYTLMMLNEKNKIQENNHSKAWSVFLDKAITFFQHPVDIVQAPDFNPTVVNTINGCFAAFLYVEDEEGGLCSVGGSGEKEGSLEEFVVEAFEKGKRIIASKEKDQTICIAEPIHPFVLCLYFSLEQPMTEEQAKAYRNEMERAVMEENEYHIEFLKLLIGEGEESFMMRVHSYEKQPSISQHIDALEKALIESEEIMPRKK